MRIDVVLLRSLVLASLVVGGSASVATAAPAYSTPFGPFVLPDPGTTPAEVALRQRATMDLIAAYGTEFTAAPVSVLECLTGFNYDPHQGSSATCLYEFGTAHVRRNGGVGFLSDGTGRPYSETFAVSLSITEPFGLRERSCRLPRSSQFSDPVWTLTRLRASNFYDTGAGCSDAAQIVDILVGRKGNRRALPRQLRINYHRSDVAEGLWRCTTTASRRRPLLRCSYKLGRSFTAQLYRP